ncbi:hypothetical protein C7M61_005259 [Candidozyma pseudohaemuli]|uniref:Uncharacterized protein n=1 Tax=Candidozyma pseudohaemuli TaxID=418784 RepID=A0A2P7YCL7_9ASCO|nr:hypothetical protein C7M61_005259 [[Candida] pseudohaemulonii]PSK33706.1 hypothetical protein C7M61_005259 [[Candida] pseudohaemulonii]
MFIPLIILAVVFCAISLYLPYSAGLTHLERRKKQQQQAKPKRKNSDAGYGYISPDEELRRQREQEEQHGLKARASALKERLNVTADDMPVLIKLNQPGLRKRTEKIANDVDPNNYDYDLEELIQDEAREANEAAIRAAYAGQELGGDKEAMV